MGLLFFLAKVFKWSTKDMYTFVVLCVLFSLFTWNSDFLPAPSLIHISRMLNQSNSSSRWRKAKPRALIFSAFYHKRPKCTYRKANAWGCITDVWTRSRAFVGRRLLRSQLASTLWLEKSFGLPELHLLWPWCNFPGLPHPTSWHWILLGLLSKGSEWQWIILQLRLFCVLGWMYTVLI